LFSEAALPLDWLSLALQSDFNASLLDFAQIGDDMLVEGFLGSAFGPKNAAKGLERPFEKTC